MKNKTLRLLNAKQLEFIETTVPEPSKDEALLKVLNAGICGSDFKMYLGKMNNAQYPITGGHEFSAEIVEIKNNSQGYKKGQLVTVVPYFNCGSCYSCRSGFLNCCENNRTMGVRRDGCYSQYVSIPIEKLLSGDGLDPSILALIEPFANAYHLVKRVGIEENDKVLLFGAGPIGILAMLEVQRRRGEVTIADYSVARLAFAKKLGADNVVNLNSGTVQDAIESFTKGDRFDVAFEIAGHPNAFLSCMEAVRYRGRVGLLGVTLENVTFNQSDLSWKEFSIIASRNSERSDFIDLISLIKEGNFKNLIDVISHKYKFDDAKQAFKDMESISLETLKVMFEY